MLLVRQLMMLVVIGCVEPSPNDMYQAPAVYRMWYDEVWQMCGAGVRGAPVYTFQELRFHAVDFPEHVLGEWRGRDIWIDDDLILWPPVVKHEMLHAQLGMRGHPPVFDECEDLRS